ncbi:MAG TPA: UvrD-helicase domain-containing protein [Geobacteraceae bacterium]
MRWSPVKEEVFRFESNIVVSAGAGSGKTAALVELYLRLLAGETSVGGPLAVEEIVAITFTDKAAVEMKERVRREIGRRLREGDRSVDWKKAGRALSVAPIATFHSFCSRLLRENPAEAGVDPSFTLFDEAASSAELRSALDELLGAEIAERSPEMQLLLRHFPLAGVGRGKGLREYLLMLCRRWAADVAGDGELRQEEAWLAEAHRLFRVNVAQLGNLLGEVGRILGGKELAFHARLRPLPVLCHERPLVIDDPGSLAFLAAMEECLAGNWGREKAVKDGLSDCLAGLRLACCQVQSAPLVTAIRSLAGRVGEAYRQRKERCGALDFDDLLVKCRDLLARDAALCAELRRRFAVVMVDEFQDTNPLQKALVDLICGPDQRLFIVGDPKQSIYLFRGADVTVFTAAQAETAASGGKNLFFQESFRSREGIITFVNRLFSRIMASGGSPFEVEYGEGDHLQPQREDWDETPCVELLTLGDEGGSEALRAREAAAIAAKIARMVCGTDDVRVFEREASGEGDAAPGYRPRQPRYGDIALLFRRFSNLKVFERALRERGIPYYVVKGRGFFRCQEILDICSFLRYLEFGGDLVSLAALLRSPLCGVSDETLYLLAQADAGLRSWERLVQQRWRRDEDVSVWEMIDPGDRARLASLAGLLGRLRPLRDRLTLAELLEEILTDTDVASVLLTTFQGGQKVANLRKLVELSRSFSAPAEGALRRFIAFLTELTTSEPTEAEAVIAAEGGNVVRLMTVHQSKGLEFPIVILPELGAGLPVDNAAVHYDERLGLGVKLPLPDGTWGATLAVAEITALRREKEAAELKRLFYVALTRARDYLILSGEGKGEWRCWIEAFRDSADGSLLRVTPVLSDGGDKVTLPERPSPSPLSADEVAVAVSQAILYAAPLPAAMVFSPTALEDFRHCPRKYFYKGVLGLDEGLFADLLGHPRRPGKGRQGMSSLEKGTLAHALLERLDFSATPGEQSSLCGRLARTAAASAGEDDIAEVSGAVMAFVTSPLGRELAHRQLFREYPFLLRLTGRAAYYLKGAMDLVAVDEKRVTVYDYKYLSREGADLAGYRFQLQTYMLALTRAWPEREVQGHLLFLKGGESEEVYCDPVQFEAEVVALMDAVRERRGEGDFSLRSGCDGGHCPFRRRCGRE